MIDILLGVMLPVVLVAAIGSAVAQRAGLTAEPIATLTFNLLSPALVFQSLRDIRATSSTVGRVVAVIIIGFAITAVVSALWSRATGEDRATAAAAALCSAVANMGNMGLPVAALAFGERGLDVAAVAFVVSSVLTYSVGVVIASLAAGPARGALSAPLRVPALWASAAALAVRYGGVPVPGFVEDTAATMAGAAIPLMLVVLGLQIRNHAPTMADLRPVGGALAVRLCIGPAVAAAAVATMGLEGVPGRTVILLGGMPTAVNTTILAAQYDAKPGLVTQAVVASSLVSLVTLTTLLLLLR